MRDSGAMPWDLLFSLFPNCAPGQLVISRGKEGFQKELEPFLYLPQPAVPARPLTPKDGYVSR